MMGKMLCSKQEGVSMVVILREAELRVCFSELSTEKYEDDDQPVDLQQ